MEIDFEKLTRSECHEILGGMIAPRPIGWVSTVSGDGVFNLAPFSFFGAISVKPPMLYISIGTPRGGGKKDTLKNIEYNRDFVVNVVNEALAEKMNQTSARYPANLSEFTEVGLTPVPSDKVKSPRVAESPINMECKLDRILEFGDSQNGNSMVIGEIVKAHITDDIIKIGLIDASKLKAVARLGGDLYCYTRDLFELKNPTYSPPSVSI